MLTMTSCDSRETLSTKRSRTQTRRKNIVYLYPTKTEVLNVRNSYVQIMITTIEIKRKHKIILVTVFGCGINTFLLEFVFELPFVNMPKLRFKISISLP